MEIVMVATFVLCTREDGPNMKVLLGQKHDGGMGGNGLAVPAGSKNKSDSCLENTAIRELWEEVGILLTPDRLEAFTVGGDQWYHVRLHIDEVPREGPELTRDGKPLWGPAQFYLASKLPKAIAYWQRKKLKKAIARIRPE